MKDPELKQIAFGKILDALLAGGANAGAVVSPQRSVTAKKVAAARKTTVQKRGGPKAHVEDLVEEGFFKNQKTIADLKADRANRGRHIPLTSLSAPLQKLCQEKVRRRQKVNSEGKEVFGYSNW